MSKFTLMRKTPEHSGSLDPITDGGEMMTFGTPQEAWEYLVNEHYWDIAPRDLFLVEIHDMKISVNQSNPTKKQ